MTRELDRAALRRLLAASPLLSPLPEKELESLARVARPRRFADRDTIFVEGEPAESSWLLLEGRARIFAFMGGDRLMEIEAVLPGEFFGLYCRLGSSRSAYPCTAVADGEILAVCVSDSLLESLQSRFPSLNRRACELCSERLRELRSLLPRSRESAERRLIGALLALSGVSGPRVRATRHSLALRLGTTVETVFRALSRLRRAGLIRTGRGYVVVEDAAALERRLRELP